MCTRTGPSRRCTTRGVSGGAQAPGFPAPSSPWGPVENSPDALSIAGSKCHFGHLASRSPGPRRRLNRRRCHVLARNRRGTSTLLVQPRLGAIALLASSERRTRRRRVDRHGQLLLSARLLRKPGPDSIFSGFFREAVSNTGTCRQGVRLRVRQTVRTMNVEERGNVLRHVFSIARRVPVP
jgi:hypothetical protein